MLDAWNMRHRVLEAVMKHDGSFLLKTFQLRSNFRLLLLPETSRKPRGSTEEKQKLGKHVLSTVTLNRISTNTASGRASGIFSDSSTLLRAPWAGVLCAAPAPAFFSTFSDSSFFSKWRKCQKATLVQTLRQTLALLTGVSSKKVLFCISNRLVICRTIEEFDPFLHLRDDLAVPGSKRLGFQVV